MVLKSSALAHPLRRDSSAFLGQAEYPAGEPLLLCETRTVGQVSSLRHCSREDGMLMTHTRAAEQMRTLRVWCLVLMLTTACLGAGDAAGAPQSFQLANSTWSVEIAPATLAVTARPSGKAPIELSAPQEGLGPAGALAQGKEEASWEIPGKGCSVSMRLAGEALSVRFRSTSKGEITWPVIGHDRAVLAYVLPLDEGSYVPADNAEWLSSLVQASPMTTTEGLAMPFWGLDCKDYSVTYLLTNPFHNALTFYSHQGRSAARLTHEFASPQPEDYEVVIRLGPRSPVEPARQYRRWLIEHGDFVSLQDKIRKTPEAAKLVGAAHVYLWGNSLLSRHDVREWRRFAGKLVKQGRDTRPSPGRRIWELLSPEARRAVEQVASPGQAYPALTREVADALSEVLARSDFYQAAAWRGIRVSAETQKLLATRPAGLSTPRLLRLNCLLLEAAFPGEFVSSDRWGDGVSVKMMERLAAAGMDRLWLGLDSWQGGFRHPQAIRKAKELGYLVATYDSYESIHRPDEPDTWETAQFDLHLYETGAVIRRNGQPLRGFQGKGYRLNPIVAMPYVKARVTRLMQELPEPFNSWFVDCDAYGDLEDDYSPAHPATQQDDMRARLDRMAWIRDTYGLVIGSERGAAYAAPVIHFAHGMMTPVIGWGDPDLQKNKASPYYLGGYWPPDGPQIMMKQVPLKPAYRTRYFDPRFRVPLYQTVFHDSVIATHHWSAGSLKFRDQTATTELLELLYGVPPLYHLNLDEFEKQRARIVSHYRFFSPLHREVALLPMTDFSWLTPDRLVQRTVFGDRVEVVANFATQAFPYRGIMVPARGLVVRWLDSNRVRTYTPAAD
jgi:hypothetical protein